MRVLGRVRCLRTGPSIASKLSMELLLTRQQQRQETGQIPAPDLLRYLIQGTFIRLGSTTWNHFLSTGTRTDL